jgi:hypothetical protein
MKEIFGDLWDYFGKTNNVICITTNGFVKKDGTGVMGRGCANEARFRIPGITKNLGDHIKANGNHVGYIGGQVPNVLAFPVKHAWYEPADPELISRSAFELAEHANRHPEASYILPRPGCGNGQLLWDDVKPLLTGLPDNIFVIAPHGFRHAG